MKNSIEIKRPQKAILTGIAILLVLLTALLHIFVRPGADDFYYSTFHCRSKSVQYKSPQNTDTNITI